MGQYADKGSSEPLTGRDELLGVTGPSDAPQLQPTLDNIARRLVAMAALFTPLFALARLAPVLLGGGSPYIWTQTAVAMAVIFAVVVAAWHRERLSARSIGTLMATATALIGLLAVSRNGINTVQVAWLLLSALIVSLFLGRKLALLTGIPMWVYAWLAGLYHNRYQFADLDSLLDPAVGIAGAGSGLGVGLLAVVMISDIVPRLLDAIEVLLREKAAEQERRWRAEQRGSLVEQRWISYFNHAPVGITLLDDSGTVVGWNRKNEQYLGMTSAQMVGRSLEDYLRSLDTGHPLLDKVAGVYNAVSFYDFLLDVPTEFGIRKLLLLAEPLFDPEGAVGGVFMAGIDITGLASPGASADSTTQPSVLSSQDGLAAMLDKLLGIRSSLLGCGLTAETISSILDSSQPDVAAVREKSRLLLDQQQVAAALADDAFRYVNDKPKQQSVQAAGRLAETAVSILRARCDREGIELVLDDAFAEGARVSAQPVLLRQILINLIGNAREALERNAGAESPRITVRVLAEATAVVFIVEDTAGGVVPVNADVYFNPSFSTKDRATDNGKGLYVSRHTAERLGGSLELEQGDQGLRFVLTLPRYVDTDES